MANTAIHNQEDTTIPTKPVPFHFEDVAFFVSSEIQEIANRYSDKVGPIPANGYFTIRSAIDGRILFVREIGDNPIEKVDGRLYNSLEKGQRLFVNQHHHSSWQSRDVTQEERSKKKYGGAIRTEFLILSFSGLPELADETLMAIVAIKLNWIRPWDAWRILAISQNNLGQDILTPLLH